VGVRDWGTLLVAFVIVEEDDLGIRTGADMTDRLVAESLLASVGSDVELMLVVDVEDVRRRLRSVSEMVGDLR
jgi:hypothetical protein